MLTSAIGVVVDRDRARRLNTQQVESVLAAYDGEDCDPETGLKNLIRDAVELLGDDIVEECYRAAITPN